MSGFWEIIIAVATGSLIAYLGSYINFHFDIRKRRIESIDEAYEKFRLAYIRFIADLKGVSSVSAENERDFITATVNVACIWNTMKQAERASRLLGHLDDLYSRDLNYGTAEKISIANRVANCVFVERRRQNIIDRFKRLFSESEKSSNESPR
ncbi:MAG: hypothetical protein A2017_18115 [Lentisphaerae bacterium GWF2_44_16]|nr:MAG: hypothetical protein A2017_18115 [Lentisphaerae bacterium GWF2_44_16]